MSVDPPDPLDLAAWHDRVDRLLPVDLSSASLEQLDALAGDLNAWCGLGASMRAACAGRRTELADEATRAGRPLVDHGDPEGGHQRQSRQSRRASARDLERERTLATFPALRPLLSAGQIGVEHVDVVASVLRDLTAAQQITMRDRGTEISALAVAHPPEQLRTALRRLLAQLLSEDAVSRFERQRRNTRANTWIDPDTKMVKLLAEFDPEIGAHLLHRLQRALDARHALPVPDSCPDDPKAKNDHLRALALLDLLLQDGTLSASASGGTPDVDLVIVIDHNTLRDGVHDHTVCDAGTGIDLPIETLRRLACTANIIPVVLGSDGVVLDLGRTQRMANRAQRRALRAMYPTCAITGCTTRFEHCKIHHVAWWGRDNGPTDIANMVPLCERHHHAVHEGGWQLLIHPISRELEVRLPDGDVLVMRPPRHGWNGEPPGESGRTDGRIAAHPQPEPDDPPDRVLRAS